MSLDGANVSHVVFMQTHWMLGSLRPFHGFHWFIATASLPWSPSTPVRRSGFTSYYCLQKKTKCDKNVKTFAEVSSSVVFAPAVRLWTLCHILGMQRVLQTVLLLSSVSFHTFLFFCFKLLTFCMCSNNTVHKTCMYTYSVYSVTLYV